MEIKELICEKETKDIWKSGRIFSISDSTRKYYERQEYIMDSLDKKLKIIIGDIDIINKKVFIDFQYNNITPKKIFDDRQIEDFTFREDYLYILDINWDVAFAMIIKQINKDYILLSIGRYATNYNPEDVKNIVL